MAILKNTTINVTGNLQLPTGTSSQKPSSPTNGDIRLNQDSNDFEVYKNGEWTGPPAASVSGGVNTFTFGQYTVHHFTGDGTFTVTHPGIVDILLVAGGGGGGSGNDSGGGGAGGLIFRQNLYVSANSYMIGVGTGGGQDQSGSNSTALGLTALGGGYGGRNSDRNPASGGSGGGGWWNAAGAAATQPASPDGGYGNRGGEGDRGNTSFEGAGGGGAGSRGVDSQSEYGGQATPGGFGLYFGNYFGNSVGEDGWFASGGSGGGETAGSSLPASVRRLGGGALYNVDSIPNTGGGGAATWDNGITTSVRAGASGVVLIRYRN